MKQLGRALLLTLCLATLPVAADNIVLKSTEGDINVEGELLSFDGQFYRLDTKYGILSIDGTKISCEGANCPDPKNFVPAITLSGSPRMADILVPALVMAFADRNGWTVTRNEVDETTSRFELRSPKKLHAIFTLRATSTSEGYADLIAEEADIALVLRNPRPFEQELSQNSGAGNLSKGLRAKVIALDGIVAAVSAAQPVGALSLDNIAAIFAGEITSWATVGGPDLDISLHMPGGADGLAEAFADRVMGPLGKTFSENIQIHPSLEDLSAALVGDPSAVGLTSFARLGNAEALEISGACGVSQRVTRSNLRTEDYMLTVPMMLYTPARRLPRVAREFVKFSGSTAADLVALRAGFVDQSVTRTALSSQGDRLAHAISQAGQEIGLPDLKRLVENLSGRQRLSTTLRFTNGSSDLDTQSRENFERLVRTIESGRFRGKDLLFAGFTDGDGPASTNLELSEKRAQSVVARLRQRLPLDALSITVAGFGEVFPIACDDAILGRDINRRVEIWVK